MKAAFVFTPAESRRLIAKAVAQMPEVKAALEKGYVIIPGSTGNAFVIEELLGRATVPARYTAGIVCHGILCVTPTEARDPSIPTILYKGKPVNKTIREALDDFHKETVIIKGANAIDPQGNVGVITSGFDGGTVAQIIGTVTSQGLKIIVPVGLEKLVASVIEGSRVTGAKTLDYSMGADFGMYCLTNTLPVTEITALDILFGIKAVHVASGGSGGAEGAVVLIAMGEEERVKAAIELVESIKGEKPLAPLKGICVSCRYACRYAGLEEKDLPAWLQRTERDLC
ncbi:MAG: hypothetical protein H5T69_12920 [Chloroflexi bacterium]|nr:hypothetical protein [Chloroflexota bacterium]